MLKESGISKNRGNKCHKLFNSIIATGFTTIVFTS